jgi:hypothetical protein
MPASQLLWHKEGSLCAAAWQAPWHVRCSAQCAVWPGQSLCMQGQRKVVSPATSAQLDSVC